MMKRLLALAFGLLLVLLISESLLWTIAMLVGDRARSDPELARAPGPEGSFRIVCVGDSNTYGAGVARDESYPAQLEQLLNEGDPGMRYEVVNLGVPGSNSGQLLRRLPLYLDELEPDLVIVTVGVNDRWNPTDMESEVGLSERLRGLALRSRAIKLIFLLVDGALLRQDARPSAAVEVALEDTEKPFVVDRETTVWQLRQGDRTLRFINAWRETLLDEQEHGALLRRNLGRILRLGNEHGVPVVLATYAANFLGGPYAVANRATLEAAAAEGAFVVPQIYATHLQRYLSPELREADPDALFFSSLHPKPSVYRAAAAHLRDSLMEGGYIPRR